MAYFALTGTINVSYRIDHTSNSVCVNVLTVFLAVHLDLIREWLASFLYLFY